MRYREIIKESQRPLYFLRNTTDPERDLHRGFSCHIDGWRKEPEHFDGALRPPVQDPDTKLWCVDPEPGLSSFACWDESSFKKARQHIEIYWTMDQCAVFVSSDYQLHSGADGEDCFTNGEFIGFIDYDNGWEDLLNLVNT